MKTAFLSAFFGTALPVCLRASQVLLRGGPGRHHEQETDSGGLELGSSEPSALSPLDCLHPPRLQEMPGLRVSKTHS